MQCHEGGARRQKTAQHTRSWTCEGVGSFSRRQGSENRRRSVWMKAERSLSGGGTCCSSPTQSHSSLPLYPHESSHFSPVAVVGFNESVSTPMNHAVSCGLSVQTICCFPS